MLSCLQPQPGQYVTETCLSGAPLVPGQNTGVSACSSCPKNTYIGSSCTSGDASNEGSQTLCYACPRHSSSPEASSRIEDCVCDAGYLRQGTGSATQCVPHCLSTTPYQSVGQGWCVSETTDDTGNGYWRAVDAESCELQCTSDVNCYAYTINAGENGCLIYTNGSEAPTGWFWIPGTVNQLGNFVGSGTHNGSCMVKQAPSSDCECPKSGCVTMPTMTLVSAGSFIMGCRVPRDTIDDDCESIMMPPHEVSLSRDLWAMQTEVTEALYVAVTGQTSAHSQCGPECPVINVTWREALSFANNLSLIDGLTPCYDPSKGTISDPAAQGNPYACEGYRLPTEAEWEYLARGGTGDAYAGSDIIADVAWYADTSNATRHPACTKAPNAYGLCDMSGNVAEWTADALFAYSSDAQVDPYTSGDTARRVIRGGSWASEPSQTRSAARSTHDPNAQTPTLGFRLVRSLP